jgi:hypothetical protein
MPEYPARPAGPLSRGRRAPRFRWECRCDEPPILLGMYEPGGQIQIKLRDRYYMASGCVHATCPRCGARHVLDLRTSGDPGDLPGFPAGDASTGWA